MYNMKIKRHTGLMTVLAAVLVLFLTGSGECRKDGYNYISIQDFKARMDAGDHKNGLMMIMTAQTEKEYATGYIDAAYPTYARPLKTDADFAKLNPFLEKIKDTDADVVLICPRGASGAERPYTYFKEHGIEEKRLLILEGGQEAFNKAYPEDVTYPKQ
jgi:thiosulfate/3-mercaptopyruvate sulfurtransferase